MSSDSDEPLSVLKEKMPVKSPVDCSASAKKFHKEKKKVKDKLVKREDEVIEARLLPQTPMEQPHDVWLYMKDFNPNGPYSCLLCPEWFIGKSKIVVHYILNHKKDYCGICRYFVDSREMWKKHQSNHIPMSCSRCSETFDDDAQIRNHFQQVHKSVNCRFCGSMMTSDQYNDHLFQRHSVTNVANKEIEVLWQTEYEGHPRFTCALCVESVKSTVDFFNHYACNHKITLQCFAAHLSGHHVPFAIFGANVSNSFIDNELRNQPKMGYVDPEKTLVQNNLQETIESNYGLLQALIPEIKQEVVSDSDEKIESFEFSHEIEPQDENEQNENKKTEKVNVEPDPILNYKGEEDFDVTLTELVLVNKSSIDYLKVITESYKSNLVPVESKIIYEKVDDEEITCHICTNISPNVKAFCKHMSKMHSVKIIPNYCCRLCMATFDTEAEFRTHAAAELNDFQDLWICQFCDMEFDGRDSARKHLTDHWSELKNDNCFSPHLGFKCRYCPTLFWNEFERENHQNEIHYDKHKEDFYKCNDCENVFSDKTWFLYHYATQHAESLPTDYMMKCAICSLVLASVQQMKRHFGDVHPEARKIFCSLGSCMYKPFARAKSFKMHIQTFHGRSARPPEEAQCVVCGKVFESARACSSHTGLAHAAGRFKCRVCHLPLHTKDERKLHQLLRHPEDKSFVCAVCGKSFKHKSGLYLHKAEHRAPQALPCSTCGKTFSKKESLREHELIHSGPRHSCSYCAMTFVQRSNMLRHERRHTGEKPYSCTHCGRRFSDRGAANSHMRTHEPSESFPCPYCGQRFVHRMKLTFHMRKHTGQDLEACRLCSKLFTNVYALRSHMKTHEDGPRHACRECGKDFGQLYYLERHMQQHHATELMSCPLCSFTATDILKMRGHVRSHGTHKHIRCALCTKSYTQRKAIIYHLKKAHNVRGDTQSLNGFYAVLDPWQCGINLDQQTMENIFGKRRFSRFNRETDVVVGEYVTVKELPIEVQCGAEQDAEQAPVRSKRRNKSQRKEKRSKREESAGEEKSAEEETCTQPTDVVLVKLEPLDSE